MPNQNSISKPVKKGTPVYFEACKTPELRNPDSSKPKPTLIFLFDGAMHLFQASADLFRQVDGEAVESGPHTGYDNLRDHHFVVWSDGDVALSVDRINMSKVLMPQRNSPIPNSPPALVEIELDTKTGDVYLRNVPQDVKRNTLLPLIRAIGSKKVIKKGDTLHTGFKVISISDDGVINLSWPKPAGGLSATSTTAGRFS